MENAKKFFEEIIKTEEAKQLITACEAPETPEDAIRTATYNPAKVIGALDEVGSIENGKCADFLVLDENYNLVSVYLRGKKLV